ncbi:hypothetical protein [Nereida ignava]|uniref:hypothetical protein n=1 Tax=Nereida ignava TaxID=282199 RepID=UPI0030F91DA1
MTTTSRAAPTGECDQASTGVASAAKNVKPGSAASCNGDTSNSLAAFAAEIGVTLSPSPDEPVLCTAASIDIRLRSDGAVVAHDLDGVFLGAVLLPTRPAAVVAESTGEVLVAAICSGATATVWRVHMTGPDACTALQTPTGEAIAAAAIGREWLAVATSSGVSVTAWAAPAGWHTLATPGIQSLRWDGSQAGLLWLATDTGPALLCVAENGCAPHLLNPFEHPSLPWALGGGPAAHAIAGAHCVVAVAFDDRCVIADVRNQTFAVWHGRVTEVAVGKMVFAITDSSRLVVLSRGGVLLGGVVLPSAASSLTATPFGARVVMNSKPITYFF